MSISLNMKAVKDLFGGIKVASDIKAAPQAKRLKEPITSPAPTT